MGKPRRAEASRGTQQSRRYTQRLTGSEGVAEPQVVGKDVGEYPKVVPSDPSEEKEEVADHGEDEHEGEDGHRYVPQTDLGPSRPDGEEATAWGSGVRGGREREREKDGRGGKEEEGIETTNMLAYVGSG